MSSCWPRRAFVSDRGILHVVKPPTDGKIPAAPRLSSRATDMKKKPSDTALLESALSTIEQVLARADSEMQGVPYFGPTGNASLDDLHPHRPTEEGRFRASPAQAAVHICLSSVAALIDVSQALMNRSADRSPGELEREWKTLIAHTKMASRSAYRAALILAAQKNVLTAQGDWPADEARPIAR
jgi:hypothetical protein